MGKVSKVTCGVVLCLLFVSVGCGESNERKAIEANNRAKAYADKGDYDKAIIDYTRAIRLNPDDTFAYVDRGKVYTLIGDYDKATIDYTHAIRLHPDNAEAYFGRGKVYELKGSKDKATADFAKAKALFEQ